MVVRRLRECRPGPLCYLLIAAMAVLCWSSGAAAQAISEFSVPTANSGPNLITLGPDGALWFTEFKSNKIGRITNGSIPAPPEYPIPTANSGAQGIAAGADGALWFAEQNSNRIGRITTSGSITEFPVPTVASQPFAITAGPDAALWFTEASGNNIGRLTTSGAFTEFPIPTGHSNPIGISAGPDGALWFTEQTGNQIGRISTAGAITEFAIPTPASGPVGITSGPDGALWFTEESVNKIGRITTSGVVSEYPVNFGPTEITPGPDGALWFTEQTANAIGEISTSGVLTEFAVPTSGSFPVGIAMGPSGTLWFTEFSGNKIGTVPTNVITVSESGTGTGTVTSAPPGIDCGPQSNRCSASFLSLRLVTLTATASAGSFFTGWGNGGNCSGTAPCTIVPGSNKFTGAPFANAIFDNRPSVMLSVVKTGSGFGTITSNPSGISCGPSCSASYLSGTQVTLTAAPAGGSTFAGWSGGGCGGILTTCTVTLTANTTVTQTFVQNSSTNIALQAAVLPLSRSVQVGATATAFATILNAGPSTASTCSIAPATSLQANFAFQTTDPTTNALIGTPNTPADIAQGAGQSFVIAFTPTAAFVPVDVLLTFRCANANPAPSVVGIDTLNLSASPSPVPDIVALVASGDPGYVDIPGATGTGDFAVAAVNLGSAAQITASANTGGANLPVASLVCQTDPISGNCLAAPAINVTTTIAANATPTFGVFVTGSAAVPDSPGVNRAFVAFTDANRVLRGETSVAIRTR